MSRSPPSPERSASRCDRTRPLPAGAPRFRALLLGVALAWATLAPAARALESLDAFPRSSLAIQTQTGMQRFDIWIADTPARSQQGLMFVRALPADQGMLFPLQRPGVMQMWMKDTRIALDMLFIDVRGAIIFIQHNATPESEAIITTPTPVVTPVKAVLELRGGECARRHIEQGDRVIYALFY
ncbi:MAG: DUF192 domain-containing protein [Steroidobacterales bacterium]